MVAFNSGGENSILLPILRPVHALIPEPVDAEHGATGKDKAEESPGQQSLGTAVALLHGNADALHGRKYGSILLDFHFSLQKLLRKFRVEGRRHIVLRHQLVVPDLSRRGKDSAVGVHKAGESELLGFISGLSLLIPVPYVIFGFAM